MLKPLVEEDEVTAFIDDLLSDESARFKRRLIHVLSELSEKEWSLLELRLRQITGNADRKDGQIGPPFLFAMRFSG